MKEKNKNSHFTPAGGHEIKCGNITKTNESTLALDVLECAECSEKHVEASAATSRTMLTGTVISAVYIVNQFTSTAGIIHAGIVILGGAFLTSRLTDGITLPEGDHQ